MNSNDDNPIELKKELIEFCTEASNRTRAVLIILLVASVLTFIAIHNSVRGSWMLLRLETRESEILKYKQLFDGENSIDSWKLASGLKEGKDPISVDLITKISDGLKNRLNKYDTKNPPDYELINAISSEVLYFCGGEVYKPEIHYSKLSSETLNILYPNRLSGLSNVNLNSNTRANVSQARANQNISNTNQASPLNDIKNFTYPTNQVDRIQLNLLILRDVYPKNTLTKMSGNEDNLNEKIQYSMLRPYSENKYYVKLPFFGAAFDINDLGIFSGIGLASILLLLRFSVSREIKNIKYGFKTAKVHGFLKSFYYSLAARQIFTVPPMKDEHRNLWLVQSPKIIILLPVVAYGYVLIYDWYSVFMFELYKFQEVWTLLVSEIVFGGIIFILSLKYYERQRYIDEIWDTNWDELENEKSAVVWLEEDLIPDFGTDKLASNALRDYKKLRNEKPDDNENV